ncbi:hypothetical protein [Corynebacterium yonathiae]|uniref:Uncharacterized protein n=1 Tax=Corynebacterium yonathiae TaxID=2913504 RepID=A0A9X3LWI3_9CORY|nr:hypothetical protein [Corynebacterium yonathiae]MCZ9295481.1 hypothetical protein [Corynebacterium yonathiae]
MLRARMRAMERGPEEELVDTLPGLACLLPAGGLARRQVVHCANCPALVVELICHLTARGGHVAVVGWPDLLLAHVADKGDIERVVTVPDPGLESWMVTGVLAEGLDLVVHHGPPGEVSPTKARPVLAKVRGGHAAVLTVGTRLPGTAVGIRARVSTYRGVGKGSGRIRGVDMEVEVTSKQGASRGVLTVGERRRLEAV